MQKVRPQQRLLGLSGFWALVAVATWKAPHALGGGEAIVIALVAVVGALCTLAFAHGPWSSTFLAALVLATFHFAAFPSVLEGDNVGGAARVVFYAANTGPGALFISVSGLSAFVSGALLFGRRQLKPEDFAGDPKSGDVLGKVAAWATVLLIVLWTFLALVQTGINPFAVAYLDFLDRAQGSSWILQPLGLFFAWSAMARGKAYKWAAFSFAVWGAAAFFIGLRGEFLFPMVAHAAVLGASRKMPKFRWIIPLVILTLLASSFGRQVRDEGLTNYQFDSEDVAISKAMAELGFSQYVVETTYRWHEVNGEALYGGSTYTAPVERLVGRALGLPMVAGDSDYRLMNVEIIAREGQIGGSVIAEALHNFGPGGVPVVLWLWGFLISLFRSRVTSAGQRILAVEALILFLFLWHVRNSFVPLPLQFGYGMALVLLFTRRVTPRRSSASQVPSVVRR